MKCQQELIGKKFNRLTVVGYDEKQKRFICVCDCSAVKLVEGYRLKSGHVKSCSSKCFWKSQAKKTFINSFIRRCRRRFSFEIEIADLIKIFDSNCYYCGSEPILAAKVNNRVIFKYNGLDRIDSSRGYKVDNVVPCCTMCNIAKNNYSQDVFFDWVKSVYTHSC